MQAPCRLASPQRPRPGSSPWLLPLQGHQPHDGPCPSQQPWPMNYHATEPWPAAGRGSSLRRRCCRGRGESGSGSPRACPCRRLSSRHRSPSHCRTCSTLCGRPTLGRPHSCHIASRLEPLHAVVHCAPDPLPPQGHGAPAVGLGARLPPGRWHAAAERRHPPCHARASPPCSRRSRRTRRCRGRRGQAARPPMVPAVAELTGARRPATLETKRLPLKHPQPR
jgi:hypothetical protein